MRSDLVSVIIPVYNAEEYLADMLADVCNQSYRDIEVIVIDDGSEDTSWEIIQRFKKVDKRIQAIRTKNYGPSSARNIGLECAQGEYIKFCDADDRMVSNAIENLVRPYNESLDIELVIGNYDCTNDNTYFLGDNMKSTCIQIQDFIDIFINNVRSFYIGVPWNKLYRAKIIKDYNIRFNEQIKWCEDFLFNIEYYSKCQNIYILNTRCGVYTYCLRESGITNSYVYDTEKMREIDNIRYYKAVEFCMEYQKEDELDIEWKYADLYIKLSCITKNYKYEERAERLQMFKDLLSDISAYEYVCMKAKEPKSYVWRFLKYVIETKKYNMAFEVFSLKGDMIKRHGKLFQMIRKVLNIFIPKYL